MDISGQIQEIAGKIMASWNAVEFRKDGNKWNLSSHDGNELRGIFFTDYSRARTSRQPTVAAVDGSSSIILDAGSFLIGAVRVASVKYRSPLETVEPYVSDMEIFYITHENYREIYRREYTDTYGSPPDPGFIPESFGDIVQRIRSMREIKTADSIIKTMEEGDIIMMDGALKADIDTPKAFLQKLGDESLTRGVTLLGVSKRSGLSFGHLPLMSLLRKKGSELFPNREWLCSLQESSLITENQLGSINLVSFNQLSDYVFRVDAYPCDALTRRPEVLSVLSRFSEDPGYLGYPFPLAQVHNASIIRKQEADAVAYRIQEAGLAAGLSLTDWEALFMDFHDVLDRGV